MAGPEMAREIVNIRGREQFDREVTNSKIPVLLEFTSEDCEPCKKMAPTIEKLAREAAGKYKVVRVDVDDFKNESIVMQFNAMKPPLMIFYDKPGAGERKVTGLLDEAGFRANMQGWTAKVAFRTLKGLGRTNAEENA